MNNSKHAQENARPRIAFGHGHISSLGSSSSMIIGHNSQLQVQPYRSPNSWVGRSRSGQ